MKQENIDKIFLDKLKDFERAPKPQAWKKLSSQIENKKKKGFIFYYSIAASVIILLALGFAWIWKENVIYQKKTYSINPKKVEKTITFNSDKNKDHAVKTSHPNNYLFKKVDIVSANKNVLKKNLKNGSVTKPLIVKDVAFLQKDGLKSISQGENEVILPIYPIALNDSNEKKAIFLYEDELNITTITEKKKTKAGKILTQLIRFKKGEKVDLNELGLDKENIIAALK